MTDTDELLALIDLLEDLLDRSDLAELEVEAGELGILLRKPGQLLASAVTVETLPASGSVGSGVPEGGSQAGGQRHLGEGRAGSDREGPDRLGAGRSDGDRAGSDRAQSAGSAQAAGSEQAAGRPRSAVGARAAAGDTADDTDAAIRGHAVIAPLTGVFYGAPSPGAAPYVTVGTEVVVGQVIGLIEAMKLFNEIKTDASGRVVRIHAADGALVRAKEPLIEIEPA